MIEAIEKLQRLIDARFSLIYVVSCEEERFLHHLMQICLQEFNEKILKVWNVGCGMMSGRDYRCRNKYSISDSYGKNDIIPMLKEILHREKHDTPTVYVLTDFHRYMKNSTVCRILRDIRLSAYTTNATVIIVSPDMLNNPDSKIPLELKRDIKILELPLPKSDEFRDIVNGLYNSNQRVYVGELENVDEITELMECGALTFSEGEDILTQSLIKFKRYDMDFVRSEIELNRKLRERYCEADYEPLVIQQIHNGDVINGSKVEIEDSIIQHSNVGTGV